MIRELFGFGVDAGMGCFADYNAQQAFKHYWQERIAEDDSIESLQQSL